MGKTFEKRDAITIENHGQKMFCTLHRPSVYGHAPAVLILHGLAGHKIGFHRMYVRLSEMLVQEGIASLRVDFRGHGDSEGNFTETTIGGQVSDALKCIDYLEARPFIDPNRIGIYSRSFGAAIAILTAKHYKNIKSLAIWSAIFHGKQWEELWEIALTKETDEEIRRKILEVNGQLPSMQFYEQLFSLKIEEELKDISTIPMLHIHGTEDPRVHISHADEYVRCRKKAKAETKFIRLEYSDHDFSHPKDKERTLKETVSWFKKTL